MFHEGIKEIVLILENCECLVIPRKFVLDLEFIGYKREFRRVACNSIGEYEFYEHVLLEIDESIKDSEDAQRSLFDKQKDLKDFILKRTDITGIEVVYEDEYKEKGFTFHPVWGGESDWDNDAATVSENALGDLLLVITEGESDMFNKYVENFKSEWDNETKQNFKKSMYSISNE